MALAISVSFSNLALWRASSANASYNGIKRQLSVSAMAALLRSEGNTCNINMPDKNISWLWLIYCWTILLEQEVKHANFKSKFKHVLLYIWPKVSNNNTQCVSQKEWSWPITLICYASINMIRMFVKIYVKGLHFVTNHQRITEVNNIAQL